VQTPVAAAREAADGVPRGPDMQIVMSSRHEAHPIPAFRLFSADERDRGLHNDAAEMQRRAARWDERVRQDGTHDRNLTMTPLLNHVMSRGSVTLRSADPHDAPVIDLNLLGDANDEDLEVAMGGVFI
jgi:choline dehydrogenase-like flavoprotein